jgi:hypothetical protein
VVVDMLWTKGRSGAHHGAVVGDSGDVGAVQKLTGIILGRLGCTHGLQDDGDGDGGFTSRKMTGIETRRRRPSSYLNERRE